MAILEEVKVHLGISHGARDADIESNIETAKAELIRAGVNPPMISESDPLIKSAIKTYCKYAYEKDVARQLRYFESFQYQVENLRKSSGYGVV